MTDEGSIPTYRSGFAATLLRGVLRFATRLVYRMHSLGHDRVPVTGGALFVCNHVSWVDALLIMAVTQRHVRFMMIQDTYEIWYVKPLARVLGVIPISSEQKPREMIKSLQAASEAIKAGGLVCIFAEGQITRIGQLLPFRRGFERIMKDVAAPIVPVALDGVWGSLFSFEQGRFLWKFPRHLPYPVTVSFGKPLPPSAPPAAVRQAVQELVAEAWPLRRARMKTISRAFVGTARRRPFRFAMADSQTPKVTFGAALGRTIFLARRLKKVWAGHPSPLRSDAASNAGCRAEAGGEGGEMVGLLLPPSVGGALANYAALLLGKIPVNLNYTVSETTLASCVQQCQIKTVLTSRLFLEKVKLKVPGEVVFIEDLVKHPGLGEKLIAFLIAFFLPAGALENFLRGSRREEAQTPSPNSMAKAQNQLEPPHVGCYDELDSLATVIFSSGSTGEPKGVMLSHYNIVSNIEQMDQVFGMTSGDRVLGILPFFHSFGFTATLCLPALLGVGVVYHGSPLDAKTIGPLVRDHAVTFLLATPTFLQLYLRGCAPGDFGSLRVVMTAAEKLPERLATAFEEQFGLRPLEGYGCTECSPAVTLNAPDFRSAGFRQVGGKRGKIGHPLPGTSVRILDVTTGEPVPLGQSGLLLVRGPNVMRGYLGKPEKTAEVLRDGWYTTGDVAALDEDGFLQITDRLSRFSKIGGEMVPHIKIEEKLHEVAGVTEQTFVVTSVADEKKGERLVVLHKLADDKLRECLEKIGACELPNLWKPKADAFFRVENFPLLGSGKLDLRKVKEVAGQCAAKSTSNSVE